MYGIKGANQSSSGGGQSLNIVYGIKGANQAMEAFKACLTIYSFMYVLSL